MIRFKTKDIAILGILIALVTLLAQIPMLGFVSIIPAWGVGMTTIHAVVIAGTLLVYYMNNDWRKGLIAGLVLGTTFGLNSLFIANTRPNPLPALDIAFQHILVSLVPRMLFGAIIMPLFIGFNTLIKKPAISLTLTAVFATLLHTLFVVVPLLTVGFKYVGYEPSSANAIVKTLWTVFYTNSIAEMVLAAIVTTPIVLRVKSFMEA